MIKKKLLTDTHLPDLPHTQDWRSYRAQLVEMESSSEPATNRALLRRPVSKTAAAGGSWAHLLPAVEPGCLLLAKQDNMQFFNQTVVLITSHGASHRESRRCSQAVVGQGKSVLELGQVFHEYVRPLLHFMGHPLLHVWVCLT